MKTFLAGAIIIVFIIVGFIGFSFYRNYSVNEGFKQIKIGYPESRVVMLMGKPSKVFLAGDKEFWSSNIVGSVKEYHYEAKILPEIWIIGFDSKGTVIYRNHNIM